MSMTIYDKRYNCLACGQNLVTDTHDALCRYAEDESKVGVSK